MKNILSIGFKLTIICAVAALCLGFVNVITEPKIEKNKEIALKEALATVNKTGTPGKEVIVEGNQVVKSYYPVAVNGETKNYILTIIGEGYAGDLKILANFEKNGKLLACILMDNQETPGLGKEAEKISYMTKYIGKGDNAPIPAKKAQLATADADAIGGATITFAGIGNALVYASDYVKKIGE